LTVADGELRTVLVQRTEAPQQGSWALPGGFVRIDESLDAAAARILAGKAGLEGIFLEQLYTFGRPDRDPRMRIISVTYFALVEYAALRQSTFTIRVPWSGERGGAVDLLDTAGAAIDLAFDHREIVGTAVARLRGKLNYAPLVYALLPAEFTLLQLQHMHETILGTRINKDSFRRRMLASGELTPTGSQQGGVDYRPAALYRRAHQGENHG
jgi:8-oxo-dGTP diphosphatase